jgi:hypothetical protein
MANTKAGSARSFAAAVNMNDSEGAQWYSGKEFPTPRKGEKEGKKTDEDPYLHAKLLRRSVVKEGW